MAIEVDRRALRRYLVGDLVVIALFVAIGEMAHGANPLAVLTSFVETAFTFLVGWGVAAPLLGGYRESTLSGYVPPVGLAVLSWAGADLIAQVLRATPVFEGDAELSFYLVAFAFGAVFLGVWRIAASWYGSR